MRNAIPSRAQRWLMQASKSGVPEAALAMGDMAARTPASRDKAANEKIVQIGDQLVRGAPPTPASPSAQFKLANAYFAGVGVARDPRRRCAGTARAAQQGMPEAQHALGIFLIGGVAGTADPVEGYKWLLLAERGGYPDSRAVREKAAEQDRRRRPQARRGAGAELRADARAADRRRITAAAARRRPRPTAGAGRVHAVRSRARRAPKSPSPSAAAPAG